MIMIFSSTRIEGLNGTYAVAGMATEIDIAHADAIYTDNKRIKAMANKLNIEVRDFPKHPPTSKETTSPKPLKIKVNVSANVEKAKEKKIDSIDEIGDVLTPLVIPEQPEEGVLTATSVPEVKPKRKPLSPEAKAKAASKRKTKALEKKKNKK